MGDLNITPGPWEWDSEDAPLQLAYGDVIGGEPTGNFYVVDEHGNIICWVYRTERDDFDVLAHIKAIAAVPEYEAHRKAQNNLREAIERRNCNPFDDTLNEAAQRAADAADAALDALNAKINAQEKTGVTG